MENQRKPKTKTDVIQEYDLGDFDSQKQAFLVALERSLGFVATASKASRIHRSSHYRWMKSDPEYADRVDLINESVKDFSESRLLQEVGKNNMTAIIFHLKSKARDRGYGDHLTVNQLSDFDQQMDTMSDEELVQLMESKLAKVRGSKG